MGMMIAPSILAADFARLGEEAAAVADTADSLHVDVMDGHFVPNIALGVPVVEGLAKATDLPLDCHLMIEDPDRWAPRYAEAGASSVTFHAEAAGAPVRTARELHGLGVRVGLGLKPATAVDSVADVFGEIDLLLLMSVEPGFGGQSFLDLVLPKIRRARELVSARELDVRIQVDGGVDAETVARCAEAGADVFVAGSSVYGTADPAAAVRDLRARAERAATG